MGTTTRAPCLETELELRAEAVSRRRGAHLLRSLWALALVCFAAVHALAGVAPRTAPNRAAPRGHEGSARRLDAWEGTETPPSCQSDPWSTEDPEDGGPFSDGLAGMHASAAACQAQVHRVSPDPRSVRSTQCLVENAWPRGPPTSHRHRACRLRTL